MGYVVGLDIDVQALKIAGSSCYDGLVRGTANRLPFRSGAFDFALCTEVIEHLEKCMGYELLSELKRVAPKRFLITTPNRNVWFATLSRIFYGRESRDHVSQWKSSEFANLSYDVRGCLGWVTARILPQWLCQLWDLLAWHLPDFFAGDLIVLYVRGLQLSWWMNLSARENYDEERFEMLSKPI